MHYYIKQLAVDVEDVVERLVFDIEQIQEDMSGNGLIFLRLKEMGEKLVSVLEISKKQRLVRNEKSTQTGAFLRLLNQPFIVFIDCIKIMSD